MTVVVLLDMPNPAMTDEEKQKQLDREIREMISALSHRLVDLQHVQKHGSSHHDGDEDDQGVRIITLAGSNIGATMRSELDEKPSPDGGVGDHEALDTYVNSNFQAINNSIMLGGSYSTNDPGVHMDIVECQDQSHKHGKKGKKDEKETSKNDQHSQHSD
ncbi:hypothetical protein F0562_007078 [Nyssa sinensis]|uniref:Uncharacterized protein n=1 Tax=Nyssa sinensis TaxID=561372 RepID=A0A5J5A551_9ASTE|nr:hypothetical protein F0562_007078 [Nyssa sinensis]